jgi:hypothetical protein
MTQTSPKRFGTILWIITNTIDIASVVIIMDCLAITLPLLLQQTSNKQRRIRNKTKLSKAIQKKQGDSIDRILTMIPMMYSMFSCAEILNEEGFRRQRKQFARSLFVSVLIFSSVSIPLVVRTIKADENQDYRLPTYSC